MQDTHFEQESRQHGGARIKNRKKGDGEYVTLYVEVNLQNWSRVDQIARARGITKGQAVDEMIAADWARRERMAEKQKLAA